MGIAVVTGANSGIGLATTIRLARDGHEVYGAMRDLDKAGALRDACIEAGVDGVHLLRIDVTNDHVIELAFEQVRKQSGPVDILVNNAGIAQSGAIEDIPIEGFSSHIDANYLGAVRCIKAVLPSMRERGTGHLVNVSSVAGQFAQVTMGAYTASKFALEGFTEVLAQEVVAYGIRVALIQPGTIRTPIFAKSAPPPDESFYPMHYERAIGYFLKTLEVAPGPDLVAATIADAITTDQPTLRHPVAPDAHALLRGRAQMTDDELVGLGALTTAEWFEVVLERFGLDLRP